jgi:hypothetical protein
MARFRKKPVEIEARQIEAPMLEHLEELAHWCGGGVCWGPTASPVGVLIDTLEGQMRADVGDWIIRGVKGELYPCKPDIFEATYDPVDAGASTSPPRLTREQAAIIGAYTGYTAGSFGDIQEYASKLLGRSMFTHEFASQAVADQLREAAKSDFLAICAESAG